MACKTVLLVDDDPGILEMMKDVLEIEGYDVALARNGHDAIDRLKDLPEVPCLIILDLMMPVMNGWEFLDFQRNRSEYKDVPVVICSAYLESAKAIRPNGIVPKPVQLDPLLGAVKSFCA